MATVVSAAVEASVTTATSLRWWLSDPLIPAAAVGLRLKPGTMTAISTDRQQVYAIMGRPDPVVLSDSFGLPALTLTIVFTTEVTYQKFEAMRATQHVFLLQGPYPAGQWYVRFGAAKHDSLTLPSLRGWSTLGGPIHTVQVTAQTVATPS